MTLPYEDRIFVPGDFIIHMGPSRVGKGDDTTYATRVVKVIEITEHHLIADDIQSGKQVIICREAWPDFRLATETMIDAALTQAPELPSDEPKIWVPKP